MKNIEIEDKLCRFIQEFGDDLNSLELLLFFSRHPNARFNRTALFHVTKSSSTFDSGLSLKRLINKNLVGVYSENGITLYSLTKEEPVRTLCIKLLSIDQRQWQILVEQVINAQDLDI